jgi:hypothetical protein
MASSTASRGRAAAAVSVLIPLIAVAFLVVNRFVEFSISSAVLEWIFMAGGVVALIAAVVAIVRGRGGSRLVGVLGLLLGLGLGLLGLAMLAVSGIQVLSGSF